MIGCDLRAGDDPDISYLYSGVVTVHTAHDYASAGTADLVCTGTDSGTAHRARIVAIKVANLTVQS